MCLDPKCDGNIIWSDSEGKAKVSYVESDGDEVTMTVEGDCENCGAQYYAVVSGDIEKA